jgi:hypothetical protein
MSMNDDVSRRKFIEGLAKTCLGTVAISSLSPLFADAKANAKTKRVIYLYMAGGMSHLDTFDPKPGRDTQGPIQSVDTAATGIQLSEHLSRLAKEMNDVALIRSLTSKEGAHDRAAYTLHTSYPPLSSVTHPSLASWIVKSGGAINQEIPANVSIGNTTFSSGFFDNVYSPFRVGDPERALVNVVPAKNVDEPRMDRRLDLLHEVNNGFTSKYEKWEPIKDYTTFYDRAVTMMKSKDLAAFEVSKEDPKLREKYGLNSFGQGVLLARRLVERGVKFVEVSLGGWDTHADNFTKLKDLGNRLDMGVSTLISDLRDRGLLKDTLVVVVSEFGRTPTINQTGGRDHFPNVFCGMLAGGGIVGGQVHGESDIDGKVVKKDPVSMQDFNATIVHALGLDFNEETISPVGRPFLMAGGGKPLTNLFT